MGTSREKLPADFDLERFIDMFDEALTSNDERVINALRSLMMMVVLTKPEGRKNVSIGPLRQLIDDMHNLSRRMSRMEDEFRRVDDAIHREQSYQRDNAWQKNVYMETVMADKQRAAQLSQDFAIKVNGGLINPAILDTINKGKENGTA